MLRLAAKISLLVCLLILLIACQEIAGQPSPAPIPDPTATPEPTPEPIPEPSSPAGFGAFLALVQAEALGSRSPLANQYMAELEETPLTGDDTAIFLWRGSARRVQLIGDMNSWRPDDASDLSRIEGTDLWFYQNRFETDARLDYRFLVDGQLALDPLNPLTVSGPQEPNSELRMPGYEAPPELEPLDREIPVGQLQSHTLDSGALGQTRTFFVYSPAGQQIGQKPAMLIINDGGDYLNLADAKNLLDRLIALRRLPPLVAVFVPPISAQREYLLNDAYVTFLADELTPFIQSAYGTDPDPVRNGILGSDLGGLAAVYAVLSRPSVFGRGAAQSGSFAVEGMSLVEQVAQVGREARVETVADEPLLYMVVGLYERAIAGRGDLLTTNRQLQERLRADGYEIVYEERPEGHSWGMWTATFGRGLIALLGPS